MADLPSPITDLIKTLASLPTVGRRSANRLAFYFLSMSDTELKNLNIAINNAREKTITCEVCGCYAVSSPCAVCSSQTRDESTICVVSFARDVFSMERMHGGYNGKYHVLGGVLSPLSRVGPEDLNIKSLIKRVSEGKVKEVIVATDSDVEGEATASYIAKLLRPYGVRITRIANGIPLGGSVEYIDPMTLSIALEGRREI